ncbi:MAG: flavodoxin [Treponema sp.]|jgi:flavodoxin|nr:flavodoxin [Treponema sp.]
MKYAVRYFSKSGNTGKVARAIASAVGVTAVSMDAAEAEITKETDILFLGAAVYAFGIDDVVKTFISKLDAKNVKKVAVFSTTALVKSARPHIAVLLSSKNIPLADAEFHCKGAFTVMHKGRPNAKDLEKAAAFAKELVK